MIVKTYFFSFQKTPACAYKGQEKYEEYLPYFLQKIISSPNLEDIIKQYIQRKIFFSSKITQGLKLLN